MPHQSLLRLFVGFEGVDYERGPMLTFVPATFHSLVLVASFGGAESAFIDHSFTNVSSSFHVRQGSLHYPWLMIGF